MSGDVLLVHFCLFWIYDPISFRHVFTTSIRFWLHFGTCSWSWHCVSMTMMMRWPLYIIFWVMRWYKCLYFLLSVLYFILLLSFSYMSCLYVMLMEKGLWRCQFDVFTLVMIARIWVMTYQYFCYLKHITYMFWMQESHTF